MLKMYENDVEVTCLPDNAKCMEDEERRSPLDLEECPKGNEFCTGDCESYAEEPAIAMNVVNCDGISKLYTYPTLDDLKAEWYAEDEPIVPMLDDRLVCGEVDGEEVHGETVKAVFDVLKEKYGWDY